MTRDGACNTRCMIDVGTLGHAEYIVIPVQDLSRDGHGRLQDGNYPRYSRGLRTSS